MDLALPIALPVADRPDAAPRKYEPGSFIADKYRLERVLGVGGMGTVWLARNVVLDLPVAIKLMLPEIQSSPDMIDRLLVEARVEAKLQHPGIVRVFDFGETDEGCPFIVMELLEGQTLGDLLEERGKLEPTFAVQILLPVIDAMDRAHTAGVVHRDLKPDNIFLTDSSFGMVPKLLDFGIAKIVAGSLPANATLRGVVMGSPSYMSPEQARGLDDIDHRADIFSCCTVLYECLAGRRAFNGSNYNSILRSVVEDEIKPLPELEACGSALWSVLRRGLFKDREARFQSMRELGSALATWLHAQGVTEDVMGVPLERTFSIDAELEEERTTLKIAARKRTTPVPASLRAARVDATRTEPDLAPAWEIRGTHLRARHPWLGSRATQALVLGLGLLFGTAVAGEVGIATAPAASTAHAPQAAAARAPAPSAPAPIAAAPAAAPNPAPALLLPEGALTNSYASATGAHVTSVHDEAAASADDEAESKRAARRSRQRARADESDDTRDTQATVIALDLKDPY